METTMYVAQTILFLIVITISCYDYQEILKIYYLIHVCLYHHDDWLQQNNSSIPSVLSALGTVTCLGSYVTTGDMTKLQAF